jgi:uncharacterized protein YggE
MRHAFSTAAATACLALLLAAAAMAPAQADAADATPRVITVSGEGSASGTPDEAMLSAGVVTSARTAAQALAANSRAMNAVFATLKSAGIADKDMQTSGFAVERQYAQSTNNAPARLSGYQVTNNVLVRVDDLGHLGATLDALVASGANTIGDIQFAIKNPKPLLNAARADAVADAMSRAQVLAHAAGVTLGPITSISESSSFEPQRPMVMGLLARKNMDTPIATGEQALSANVTITWEIR